MNCNPENVTLDEFSIKNKPPYQAHDPPEINLAPVVLVILTLLFPDTVMVPVKMMSPVTVMSALSDWHRADNPENDEA